MIFFFFQAEDGIRDLTVTGVQTCALPIYHRGGPLRPGARDRRHGAPAQGMMRHFLSSADLTRDAALQVFQLAADLKQRWKAGRRGAPLAGRTMALIFEKPALRTRLTFEGRIH